MLRRLLIALVILPAVFSVSAVAQEATATQSQNPADKSQAVSAEKQALIKELLDGLDFKKTAEGTTNAMFDEFDRQTPEIIWQSLSTMKEIESLTPAERESLRSQIAESAVRSSVRFRKLLAERLDFLNLIEQIATELYAKYFSETELRDLIVFYKSSTGKRTLEVMPNLMVESMAKVGEKMHPIFKDLMNEASKDETSKLQARVTELVKSHHKTASPRNKTRQPKKQ